MEALLLDARAVEDVDVGVEVVEARDLGTEAARRLEDLGFLARDSAERSAPAFLFCTSAAEDQE